MLLFFILFVPLFVLILLAVHMLVATNNPDSAKMAPYECGMPPASDARHKFQISFFLVAILFLVFDLEILFLYPLVVSLYHISTFGFWVAMVFILLLTVGFVAELASGALDYASHRTTSSPTKNFPYILNEFELITHSEAYISALINVRTFND
uniref:NADH-ubiquinone oxidoreductase chain 3 n=1 Tax=Glomus cerebriforme TaxID=658196 RepID=S4UJR8_9GLOM|nr:NADH dehydrogenase subunit 3 [Glomus cerebriforme]AGJ98092.1 NADH dehydrogenase subunit 3 [Glomus cerebriforme]